MPLYSTSSRERTEEVVHSSPVIARRAPSCVHALLGVLELNTVLVHLGQSWQEECHCMGKRLGRS